ncbi:eceriferum 2-like protein, partial [Tanacetum coccineum]
LSEFVGGGLAIGISFTHILADPTSATLFYKSWTDAERGEPSGHSPPILGLPPLDNTTLPTTTENTSITIKYLQDKSKLAPTSSKKMATSTFKFSNTTMKHCLSKIAEKYATPFDYLTALFWLQILELKTLNAHSHTHSISLCIDARNHLDAPIPMKLFGNALSFSKLSLKNEDLVGDIGLAEAVELVHHQVNAIKKDEIASMINWLESSHKGMDGVYPEAVQMYGPELTFVSLEHLMTPKDDSQDDIESLIYDARFRNNEKPVHVSYHVGKAEGEGLIVISPSPEGGVARTVTVTLPAEEIVKLCQDSVIMEMEPTMIVSGKI